MRTKSFELEETVPGIFLLQGWLGGILAAFVYVVAFCLFERDLWLSDALMVTLYLSVLTGILGVMKSVIMWVPYRLTKFQPHAVIRVAIASIGTGCLALALGFLIGPMSRNDRVVWVLTLLVAGLPTAILVGSKIKPWELFTFGSIAGKSVRSVWGTLGTLPLRFLSLVAVGAWILSVACTRGIDKRYFDLAAVLSFSLVYFIFSAYITFRSPPKAILIVFGLVVNLPLAFSVVLTCLNFTYLSLDTDTLVLIGGIRSIFLAAWLLFFVARLSVSTRSIPIDDLRETLLKAYRERNHECLGSRFMAWHT